MRPIDADALSKHRRNHGKPYAIDPIDKNIDDQLIELKHVLNAPTLDYAPVKRGEWVKATGMMPPEFHGRHKCSLCGHFALSWKIGREEFSHYCPNCGARMDWKEDGKDA